MSRRYSEKLVKGLTGDKKRRGEMKKMTEEMEMWVRRNNVSDGVEIRSPRGGCVPMHKRPRLTQPLFPFRASRFCLQSLRWGADDYESPCQTGRLLQATSSFSGVRD